jgi:hypothetical protein
MRYMSIIIYANIGVKSFIKTYTIQPAAPKLLQVHFDILNLKNVSPHNRENIPDNLCCVMNHNFLLLNSEYDGIHHSTIVVKNIYVSDKEDNLNLFINDRKIVKDRISELTRCG